MAYKVVEADLSKDKEEIINLWRRNFPGSSRPEKRFDWIFGQNPYGPAKCWLLMSEKDHAFVGCATLIPRRIYINGTHVMVGIVADTVMDQRHRTMGPSLMLQRAAISEFEKGNVKFIIGFPNKLSEAVNIRAGYKIMGNYVRMVKVFRSEKKLGELTNTHLSKIISPIIDFGLNLDKYFRKRGDKLEKVSFEEVESFDDRFDELWERFSKEDLVIGERSRLYLNWRYTQYPYGDFKVFCARNERNNLLGYIVFRMDNNEVFISDIFSHKLNDVILYNFLERFRNEHVDSTAIGLVDNDYFVKLFKRSVFLKRENIGNIVLYCDGDLRKLLGNPLNWYLFYGDTDV